MLFDYEPTTPVLIIANGLSLLYYDEELKEATFLPLWKTPLWFLIREEVRFDDNVEIVAIEEALGTLRITLRRSEEHTSELQSLMRISYAVFCLKKQRHKQTTK